MSNISDVSLKYNQIVCLEHQGNCLYGEVIQLIPERRLCWFRTICMVILDETGQYLSTSKLIDLRLGADLLWPIALFRPALDTEVMSFWGKLNDNNSLVITQASNREHLNSFIRLFWQHNKDKF